MNQKQILKIRMHVSGIATILVSLAILIIAYIGINFTVVGLSFSVIPACFYMIPFGFCSILDSEQVKYYLLYYSIALGIIAVALGLIDPLIGQLIGPLMIVVANMFGIMPL